MPPNGPFPPNTRRGFGYRSPGVFCPRALGNGVAGGDVWGSQLCPCPPAACRLTAVERAATSAEETDIDAVELPLPGAGILDFSRGVTDLDAVGKEASADAKVRGSLRIPVPRGGGFLQHCPAPGAKPSAAALWLGARGAPAEHRARRSRALMGTCPCFECSSLSPACFGGCPVPGGSLGARMG